MVIMDYDYIIIGSNPSGLTLAYYLSKMNKNILLVDGNQSMNYNKKIDYLYTTNVNIYSNSFVNLIKLLKDEFKVEFNDLFNPMKLNSDKFFNFDKDIFFNDFLLSLSKENIDSLLLDKFINQYYHNYSISMIDKIDLVCKTMLGKSYDETKVEEFINLQNKEIAYKFYQPKEPLNDKLYNIWLQNIHNTKNCNVLLDSTIGEINGNNNIAQSVEINDITISAKNIIYCIDTKINNTICMTFHWNTKLDLQDIWTLPDSDWELFYLVQSDYTYFNDIRSQTVISIKIHNLYAKSSYIYKTALECSKEELINETFRQLKEVFINLPNPTDISMINNNNNLKYENYENVHVINNHDSYDYIEQSIIKSKNLINKLENNNIEIYNSYKLTEIIKYMFVFTMAFLIYKE